MFSPKCGFCGGTSFKLGEPLFDVQGAHFKMPFVVCSRCNAAIAVLSQFDPGVTAKAAEDKIDKLAQRVSHLESAISTVNGNVGKVLTAVQRLKH